ncbi:MAG: MFS transporter [Elusimicrobia bacterium]|nr:MFS transporter [Elusimicrobiota bacterium]
MNKIKDIFRAFKYKNFRLFFPSLAITQIGMWIQNISISWLIYDITKSALAMGTMTFISTAPLFLFTPFTGALADKFNRHKLLMCVQTLYIIQAFFITVCTFSGLLNVWVLVISGVIVNSIGAIDAPVRQSCFVLLVDDKKDLSNAISLNSSCFNLARFIGPAIGGILLGKFGAKYCFLVNFLFLLPTFFLIKSMTINDIKTPSQEKENVFQSMKEGVVYAVKNPPIITAVVYLFLFSCLVMCYQVLLPIYTADALVSKADTLGYLLGATGVGSLVASLFIASRTSITGLRRILFTGCMLLSAVYIFTGFNTNIYSALVAMFFFGVGMTFFVTPQNVLVQTAVDDSKRGRIISLNALSFLGTTSIGSLFAGTIAHKVGIQNTFIIFGSLLFVISCIFSYMLSKFDYSKKL